MSERMEFTIEEGLNVQANNLEFWKKILHKEVYAKLYGAVMYANESLPYETGYDVIRGQTIQEWVLNYHNEYKPF